MKLLMLIMSFALSIQAMAREIPAIADIDWKCEEGVGNLENPQAIIWISGKFETPLSRQLNLTEKQQLLITVFVDGQPVVLNPSDYVAEWSNDEDFQSLVIQYKDVTYRIETTPGNALLLEVTRPGLVWGTRTQVGSCN